MKKVPQNIGWYADVEEEPERQVVPSSGRVSAVAWDSPNYLAPLHDVTVAKPTPTIPQLSGGTPARPGAPGTPPSSSDCRQGRWYERTPEVLPANWPLPRRTFGAGYDRKRGVLVIDSGFTVNPGSFWGPDVVATNSTWEWDGTRGTWRNRSTTSSLHPFVLSSMMLAFDSSRNRMVAVAGTGDADGDPINEVWSWDSDTAAWTNLGCDSSYSGPPHLGFYDDSRDEVWGLDGNGNGGRLSVSSCAWTSYRLAATEQAIGVLGFAFDTQRKLGYVVDGENPAGMVWEWTDAITQQRPAQGTMPPARRYNNVAFDEDRGRLMMFSGGTRAALTTKTVYLADLWEWDPESGGWTMCSSGADGPAGRADATLIYDANRHALLLLGGYSTDGLGTSQVHTDIWEWAIP